MIKIINREDLEQVLKANVLTPSEVCSILQITRQRLSAIVGAGKLKPFKDSDSCKLYLRSDVIDYRKIAAPENKKVLFDDASTTYDSLKFFHENISSLSNIESIHIFFEKMDAVVRGYYRISDAYSYNNLRCLNVPRFIICDCVVTTPPPPHQAATQSSRCHSYVVRPKAAYSRYRPQRLRLHR